MKIVLEMRADDGLGINGGKSGLATHPSAAKERR